MQKRKLLWHILKEVGWIALFKVVKPDDAASSWRGFVKGVDMFQGYGEQFQHPLLSQRFMLALLNNALLRVIGFGAFGLTQRMEKSIELFSVNRKQYVSTVISLEDNYIKRDSQADDEEGSLYARMIVQFNELVKDMVTFNQGLFDAILDDRFDLAHVRRDMAALNTRRENALRSVGIHTKTTEATSDLSRSRLADEAESERLFRTARRAGWLRNLLRPSDPAMKARAEEERDLACAVAKEVFYRNLRSFLNSQDELSAAIMSGHNHSEINDAFLWGILDQFLASRPPLPTEPHGRLMLHEAFFISEEEQIPFITARERVFSIESKLNDADPLIDTFIEFGRQAFREAGNGYLVACHRAALVANSSK